MPLLTDVVNLSIVMVMSSSGSWKQWGKKLPDRFLEYLKKHFPPLSIIFFLFDSDAQGKPIKEESVI